MGKYRILVVGGGIGGMASAIRLKEDGHDVELIDLDPHWRVQGPARRRDDRRDPLYSDTHRILDDLQGALDQLADLAAKGPSSDLRFNEVECLPMVGPVERSFRAPAGPVTNR